VPHRRSNGACFLECKAHDVHLGGLSRPSRLPLSSPVSVFCAWITKIQSSFADLQTSQGPVRGYPSLLRGTYIAPWWAKPFCCGRPRRTVKDWVSFYELDHKGFGRLGKQVLRVLRAISVDPVRHQSGLNITPKIIGTFSIVVVRTDKPLDPTHIDRGNRTFDPSLRPLFARVCAHPPNQKLAPFVERLNANWSHCRKKSYCNNSPQHLAINSKWK